MITRSYAVSVSGDSKVTLDALCALTQESASGIVRKALRAYLHTLPSGDRKVIEDLLERATKRGGRSPETGYRQVGATRPAPKVVYSYSRLCFKRDRIESLPALEDEFQVKTPFGAFQMSKAEFLRDFPKVRESASYKEAGYYSYPVLPARAERYRVSDSVDPLSRS
jgi:hypothetical protein